MESFGIERNHAIQHAFKSLEPNKRKIKFTHNQNETTPLKPDSGVLYLKGTFHQEKWLHLEIKKHFAC